MKILFFLLLSVIPLSASELSVALEAAHFLKSHGISYQITDYQGHVGCMFQIGHQETFFFTEQGSMINRDSVVSASGNTTVALRYFDKAEAVPVPFNESDVDNSWVYSGPEGCGLWAAASFKKELANPKTEWVRLIYTPGHVKVEFERNGHLFFEDDGVLVLEKM